MNISYLPLNKRTNNTHVVDDPHGLGPFLNVAEDVGPALGPVLNAVVLQSEVPDVELGDLPAPGLAAVEAAAEAVLVLAEVVEAVGSDRHHGVVPRPAPAVDLLPVDKQFVEILLAVVGDTGVPAVRALSACCVQKIEVTHLHW